MIDHEPHDLLEHVFDDEPPHTDSVAEVYRRAEVLRRSRARMVVAAGVCTVLLVALTGYGFTSAMLPRLGTAFAENSAQGAPQQNSSAQVVPGGVDHVRDLVAAHLRNNGLQLADENPRRGDGWREYRIVDLPTAPSGDDGGGEDKAGKKDEGGSGGRVDPDEAARPVSGSEAADNDDGRETGDDAGDDAEGDADQATTAGGVAGERGVVRVAVYTAPGGLCFPVTSSSKRVCAKTSKTPTRVEFASYADDTDVDAQFTEVIARRPSDGRTVAVMVSGVPGTGSATRGRPALSALKATGLALDRRLPDAFGNDEWCDRPDPDCPALQVPMPAEG